MLREDVYPYDYMHEQANSNEPLPEKEEFSINLKKKILQMQITCMQKEFVKTLVKKLGEYHNLHLKNDILL